MLLPELADVRQSSWVARDGKHGLIVGAAAATEARRPKRPVGPGVALHVIPPCRRNGIGRSLVSALAAHAVERGDEALYAARRVDVDGEEFAAWCALGFGPLEIVEHHALDIGAIVPRLAPLIDWLRNHDRIPANARIVPLYAADRDQVLQLHLDHLGGDRENLLRRLAGVSPESFHPRYSRVLLLDDRAVGCVLAHRSGAREATVDAVVVIPELRNDWANAWLKFEACQGAMAIGVTHLNFASFDQYKDTRLFTAQAGGATIRKTALFALPIEGSGVQGA